MLAIKIRRIDIDTVTALLVLLQKGLSRISDDAIEPGIKRALPPKVANCAVSANERFLRNVIGVNVVVDVLIGEIAHLVLITQH